MEVYQSLKSGSKRFKVVECRNTRREIESYKQGFSDGFSKGYRAALRNNFGI